MFSIIIKEIVEFIDEVCMNIYKYIFIDKECMNIYKYKYRFKLLFWSMVLMYVIL